MYTVFPDQPDRRASPDGVTVVVGGINILYYYADSVRIHTQLCLRGVLCHEMEYLLTVTDVSVLPVWRVQSSALYYVDVYVYCTQTVYKDLHSSYIKSSIYHIDVTLWNIILIIVLIII